MPSLCESQAYVRPDRDALEQLVDLVVAQLLAEAREHVAQLADTDVAGALLVKHLEAAHKLLCRSASRSTTYPACRPA